MWMLNHKQEILPDGENNGKPYFLMDDLGAPLFLETPMYQYCNSYISHPAGDEDFSIRILVSGVAFASQEF